MGENGAVKFLTGGCAMERREIPIEEFDAACRAGRIADAEISTFGEGYGEPYTGGREVIGTLNGEPVKAWKAGDG